jgi:hypothetical protein
MYVGASGDTRVYTCVTKGSRLHLEKHVVEGSYAKANCVRFVCSCISLSGPLSELREP